MSGDTVALGIVGIFAPLFTAWAAKRSIQKQHELTMAEMRGQFGATLDSHGREIVEVKSRVEKIDDKLNEHIQRLSAVEATCEERHKVPPGFYQPYPHGD